MKSKKGDLMLNFSRDEIIDRLLKLDLDADLLFEEEPNHFDIYLVGGGALILQSFIPRSTHNIDTINVKNNSLSELMEKYDINANSNAYLDCFANDYQSRAVKLNLGTKVIDYYTLSLEDVVISKIAAGREKDIEDINNKNVVKAINWELLGQLANTVREGMISDRQISEFNHFYQDFLRVNKK